jgi:hypothetical protein
MANFTRLHDLYSFPGFDPAATIRGVFGDPYAVVVTLRRRRKKRPAAYAAPDIAPSTTKPRVESATSTVVAAASTWSSRSAASPVECVRP